MCFIASWFPVQLLPLNTILNTPWGYREDSWFPWTLKTNTIWAINSSQNLELLKQSYVWIISSQLAIFILRVMWWWKRLFWPLIHIKTGKRLSLCPAQHGASSCHTKTRSGAGPVPPLPLGNCTGWVLEEKGTQKCLQHGAHWKTLKSQEDLKKVRDFASANPIAKFRTRSSLKENIHKQHSSGEN